MFESVNVLLTPQGGSDLSLSFFALAGYCFPAALWTRAFGKCKTIIRQTQGCRTKACFALRLLQDSRSYKQNRQRKGEMEQQHTKMGYCVHRYQNRV